MVETTTTTDLAPTLEIVQDYSYDEDFGLGSPIPTYWAVGHGHDPDLFVHAVVDYALDEHGEVPRIVAEDRPVEMWQLTIERQDSVVFKRTSERPTGYDGRRAEPITMLDLDRPGSGGTKCGVDGCLKPWSMGSPASVHVEPNEDAPTASNPYMSVRLWFCREHARQFPEPSYRVCMVPVGATIMLPAPENGVGR